MAKYLRYAPISSCSSCKENRATIAAIYSLTFLNFLVSYDQLSIFCCHLPVSIKTFYASKISVVSHKQFGKVIFSHNSKIAAENKKTEEANKKTAEDNKEMNDENCTRAKMNLNNVQTSNRVGGNRGKLEATYQKDIDQFCK